MERLDKFLCNAGACTRSQSKAILKAGRVQVDGTVETDGSRKVDPSRQTICLDGAPLTKPRRVVAMLNKPAGYVTATQDPVERTVMELLPPALLAQGVKPVGRLDKATEGLLIFTNDGELIHKLISPKNRVRKRYYARHVGQAAQADVEAFAQGLELEDGTQCLPALLEPLGPGESSITLWEGKYHQVRRMMAARHMQVLYLERQQEGGLTLEGLPRGAVRELAAEEVARLEAAEEKQSFCRKNPAGNLGKSGPNLEY